MLDRGVMAICMQAPQLSQHGFRHGFSLRLGGVSTEPFSSLNLGRDLGDLEVALAENHRRLAEAVGYAPDKLVEVRQVHGSVAVAVPATSKRDELRAVRDAEADALVTGDAGVAVAVRTADCVPLLLADPESGAVAAVHAGWRGVVAGVVREAVAVLRSVSHAPSTRIVGAILPHIRSCCFEVGDEVAKELAQITESAVVDGPTRGKAHGHLANALYAQLRQVGVPTKQVDDVSGCTRCDATRFYSYRRDGKDAGRHLSVIVAR